MHIPVEDGEDRPAPEAEELDPILPPEQKGTAAVEEAAPEEDETLKESVPSPGEADTLKQDLADLNDRYVRLHAEFDNYKKRVAKDRDELRKFANEGIVMELLSVIDHLEMAVKHAQGGTLEDVVQGVELTLKEFERVLENNGVRKIEALGCEFDPNIHHAMSQVATTDAAANTVVEVFRKGYQMHEKVIRPSLVAVAGAPPEPDTETDGGDVAAKDSEDN